MQAGALAVEGDAASPQTLAAARLSDIDILFVATPDAFEPGAIVETARVAAPASA